MEAALIVVAVAVTIACAVIALFTLAASGKAYGQIGSGGTAAAPARETAGERDDEIRQMLEARNARRARRGEAPLAVEGALGALGGEPDDQLRDEVRQLVLARNRRRERRGEAPLDVDSEIDRELRELS